MFPFHIYYFGKNKNYLYTAIVRFLDLKPGSEVFEFPVNFILLQVLLKFMGSSEIFQIGRIKIFAVSIFMSMLPADFGSLAVTAAPAAFIQTVTGRVKFNVPLFPVINENIHIFMKKVPPYMINAGLGVRFIYLDCNIGAALAAAFFTGRNIFIICHNSSKF
jgi:hypothetical protein